MEQNKGIWYPNLGDVDMAYMALTWKFGQKVTYQAMTERLKTGCRPNEVLATNWINRHLDKDQRGPYYPLVKV
jgi:hypothetical protein